MYIAIIIIIILIIIGFILYNKLVKLKINVKQAKSTIDVYYQQRFDLIPNLVEVTKEYKRYEEKIFKDITELRSSYNKTKDIKIGENLDSQLNQTLLVIADYPELKASEQFLNLQRSLQKMESQLQAARRLYNNEVANYNTKISIIPYIIIAKIFGFNAEPFFEIVEK